MKIDGKYQQFKNVNLRRRNWPNNCIKEAPIWCSVDLRDGNQALETPMGIEQKKEFFLMLVSLGFKQIEVGFPSSNDVEFSFIRQLIEESLIPDDVFIQILCPAREKLIARSFEAIKGSKNVIFHLYNATSPAQRKYNFNKTKDEIVKLATDGVKWIKKYLKTVPETNIVLEYSPENFSETEIDFSIKICQAVVNEWKKDNPTWQKGRKNVILNLPTTVENCLPNHFADLIEYFSSKIKNKNELIISLHNHNDRGESVAQCELGLLAGAQRVEGCLFGNGERTGNLDVVTVALNMYTLGVDPKLDFSNLKKVALDFSRLTGMEIHPRSPYAGNLVFTAFSGSHQDAIRKAMLARKSMPENAFWDVPYLHIDPHDIGFEYEGIIRINNQSGKGGAVYVLETDYGISAPKKMHGVIGELIKEKTNTLQKELTSQEVYDAFAEKFINTKWPLNVLEITQRHIEGERGSNVSELVAGSAVVEWEGKKYEIAGNGNGPLDSFANALNQTPVLVFDILDFHEHSIGSGTATQAIAYVQIKLSDGRSAWGVGKSSNVGRAGIAAVVSAINICYEN